MLIKHINYDGNKYPVRVGYYALKHFQEETGKTISQLSQDDLQDYESLLFYSLKQGHKKENKPFNFKKEQMEDVLDECFFEFMELIPDFFPKARQTGNQKAAATAKLNKSQGTKGKS